MFRLEEHEQFSIGFEIGFWFLDLMLGYYVIRIGQTGSIIFEEDQNGQ
jgi:hypothetical protein